MVFLVKALPLAKILSMVIEHLTKGISIYSSSPSKAGCWLEKGSGARKVQVFGCEERAKSKATRSSGKDMVATRSLPEFAGLLVHFGRRGHFRGEPKSNVQRDISL